MNMIGLIQEQLDYVTAENSRLENELRGLRFVLASILKTLPGKEYNLEDYELLSIQGTLDINYTLDKSINIRLIEKGDERVKV